MNSLDGYIDRMHERELQMKRPAVFGKVPPQFTRPGSIFNAIVSSVMVAAAISFGFTQPPFGFGFLVAAVFAALATVFIRIAVRVFRGDFDPDR